MRDAYQGLEGLNKAADAVEALLATPGWDVLMELLEVERQSVAKKIERGLAPLEQAEYALLHGRLGGLRAVQEQAHALLARRADEMEKQRAKHEGERQRSPGEV